MTTDRKHRDLLIMLAALFLALVMAACTSATDPWPACEERTLPMYAEAENNRMEVVVVQTTYCVTAVGMVP